MEQNPPSVLDHSQVGEIIYKPPQIIPISPLTSSGGHVIIECLGNCTAKISIERWFKCLAIVKENAKDILKTLQEDMNSTNIGKPLESILGFDPDLI